MRRTWALLTVAAEAGKDVNSANGVGSVITMLEDVKAKGKAEAQAEKETYSKFNQWCAGTTSQLAVAITKNKEVIALQTATYEENTALAADKAAAIQTAESEIAALEGEIAKSKDERAEQKQFYLAITSELSANIAACEQAKDFLKKERDTPASAKDEAAFLQVTEKLTAIQRSEVRLLMQLRQAPGWKHENKSGQVVQMIDDLMAEFVANRQAKGVEENNRKGAHQTIVTQKNGQITVKKDDIGRWQQEKGAAEIKAGAADEARSAEQATLAENSKSETDVKILCAKKTEEFAARQKLREEEYVAIDGAIEALHGAVGTGKEKQADSGAFTTPAGSFLQLGTNKATNDEESSVSQVAALIQAAGQKTKSKQMMLLAVSMKEGGPFDKIISMIKGLKKRLIEEKQAATGKHMKCKAMMDENTQSLKECNADIETYNQKIDENTGIISQQTENLVNYAEAQATADALIAEKNKIRAEESAENAQTVADAVQAIDGIEMAMKIISEFQSKAGQAESLVQQPVPISIPQTWDKPYQGSGEHGSILDVLQILMEEFRSEKSTTEMDEATDKKAHEDFLYDEKVAKTQRDANTKNAQKLKADAEEELSGAENDLDSSQKELKSLLNTKNDIEVTQGCVAYAGMTPTQVYEAEAEKRNAEIESLEQGLEILKNVKQ